jgi:hypothetical protein
VLFRSILAGKRTELPSKKSLTVEQIAAFVHAPLSSFEVERSFSHYMDFLRDNRRRLTMENLKHLVIVKCNRRQRLGKHIVAEAYTRNSPLLGSGSEKKPEQ